MLDRDEVVIGGDRGYRRGGDVMFFVTTLLLAFVVFASATAAWLFSDMPSAARTVADSADGPGVIEQEATDQPNLDAAGGISAGGISAGGISAGGISAGGMTPETPAPGATSGG